MTVSLFFKGTNHGVEFSICVVVEGKNGLFFIYVMKFPQFRFNVIKSSLDLIARFNIRRQIRFDDPISRKRLVDSFDNFKNNGFFVVSSIVLIIIEHQCKDAILEVFQ